MVRHHWSLIWFWWNNNRFTGKFNPNKDTEQKFSQFWIKIVQYGSGKYLNENKYISILKYTVYGVAITDLMSLIDGGNSLTEIVNGLAALYDDVETLDDFIHQVDNFSRAKKGSDGTVRR